MLAITHLPMDQIELTDEVLSALVGDEPLVEVVDALYRGGTWDIERVIRHRWAQHASGAGRGMGIVEPGGILVGWYGAFPYAGDAYTHETTVYVASKLWGAGLMRPAYEQMLTWQDVAPTTCISIHEDNARSLAAHRKLLGPGWALIEEPFRARRAWLRPLLVS